MVSKIASRVGRITGQGRVSSWGKKVLAGSLSGQMKMLSFLGGFLRPFCSGEYNSFPRNKNARTCVIAIKSATFTLGNGNGI